MTQTQLLFLCRLRIPEIVSTDVISDANLLIFLNLACTEFINKTEAIPTSSTFNLVLDLTEYPLSTYITTFSKVRKEGLWIYNAVSTKWKRLDSTTVPYLSANYPDFLNTSSGLPQRYSIDGDTLTLHPKASSTYAGTNYLKLFYYKSSVDMVSSSDYPFTGSTTQRYPHLADYEEGLIDYVRFFIKQMLKKNVDAEESKQTFYQKCAYIKTKLNRDDLLINLKLNVPIVRQMRDTFK